jgi:hypothetical protein
MSFSLHRRILAGIILIVFLFVVGWQMMYSPVRENQLITSTPIGSADATELNSTTGDSKNKELHGINNSMPENSSLHQKQSPSSLKT